MRIFKIRTKITQLSTTNDRLLQNQISTIGASDGVTTGILAESGFVKNGEVDVAFVKLICFI